MEAVNQRIEVYDGLTHKPARPMKVVADRHGTRWLCDKSVDEDKDLEVQGCWRCGDLAFTRDD